MAMTKVLRESRRRGIDCGIRKLSSTLKSSPYKNGIDNDVEMSMSMSENLMPTRRGTIPALIRNGRDRGPFIDRGCPRSTVALR